MRAKDPTLIVILVGLCALLFGFELGTRPIWDLDEGMHASTSKVMVETGDWIVPKLNGENFYNKPALHNWFVAIAFTLLGFTEFAARLPAALIGLASVLVTFWLGRRMFGSTAGFFGGAVLATSLVFTVMARTIVHDISLAFFVLLSLALFYIGYTDVDLRKRGRHLLLFWVALAFAVLAKGPIGGVLVAMPIGLFLLYKRDLGFLRHMRLGWGIPLFLLIAAPWYVVMSVTQDDYVQKFFVEKHFSSVTGQLFHQQPFYWYVPVLLLSLLPWSFFLPAAAADAARTPKGPQRDAMIFLLLWCGTTFGLFSAASTKLETYILPMFAGLALILGRAWDHLVAAERPSEQRGFKYAQLLLLVVVAGGLVVLFFFFPTRLTTNYGIPPGLVQGGVLAMLAFGILGWLALRSDRPRILFGSFLGMAGFLVVFFALVIAPLINPYRTTRELGFLVDPYLQPDEPLRMIRRSKESTIFYTGRLQQVADWPAVDEYFGSDERVFALVHERLLGLLDQFEHRAYIVAHIGDEYAISNRPGDLIGGAPPPESSGADTPARKEVGGE